MAKLELPIIVKCTEIDELIDEIKHLRTYKLFEGDEQVLIDRNDTIEIFAKHIRASAQPEQRWIPVSEKLPNFAQRVLVSTANYVYEAIYFDEDAGWSTYNVTFKDVGDEEILAWIPLPEPYNGEQA